MISTEDTGPLGICAIFKDEAPHLLEWIAYHLAIGFDHIVLYDNASNDDGPVRVSESIFSPFVTINDWPQRPGQLSAFAHFIESYAKFFEWVAFIDIDEFIHPLDQNSIRDVLPRYAGVSSVLLQWLTFGSSGHAKRPKGLTIERYNMRLPEEDRRSSWVKSVVRTSDLLGIGGGPHVFEVSGSTCNALGEIVRPLAQMAQCHIVMVINHYFTRSLEDWKSKRLRGYAGLMNPGDQYGMQEFENHDQLAIVRDNRIKRFVPLVKETLAKGPARSMLTVRFDEDLQAEPHWRRPPASPPEQAVAEAAAPPPQASSAVSPPVLHIDPAGGLADQMIQYMLALKFASLVPGCQISNVRLPDWGIDLPEIEVEGESLAWTSPRSIDMESLARRMNAGELRRLQYGGRHQRMEYLLDRASYRDVFQTPDHRDVGYGADHLVCHLGAADAARMPNDGHVLAPVEFYRDIVAQTRLRPVFIGDTGPSHYTNRLLRALPQAIVRPPGDLVLDFEIIRQSRNIVIGSSRLSWLAAWLSDAEQIIFPVNGALNPCQDRRVNLLPLGDARYRFHLFPINYAEADAEVVTRHRAIEGLWREVPHDYLRRLLKEAPRIPRRIEPFLELFDEDYYVARFPSVRKALADGWLASGLAHFTKWGFEDGLDWWSFDLDEPWYTTRYPMAALEIAQGDYVDCRHHYAEVGRLRGYKPCKDTPAGRSEPALAATAAVSADTLHFTFRASDTPAFFLPSLTIGEGHPDVMIADDNAPPPFRPYVCVIAIGEFWRLDPRKCAERDVPHFSASIDRALAFDVRAGRAILALDLTNEGPEFDRSAFDHIHEVIDAQRLPARSVVWIAQNRAVQAAYEAAYKDSRANLIRFEYYDFYVKSLARRFADAQWRGTAIGDDETFQRNLLDPANKDRIALCLNATPRRHRLLAIAALRSFGLFDDSLVSLGGLDDAAGRSAADAAIAMTENSKDFSWLLEEMRTVVRLPRIAVDSFQETGNSLWDKIDVQSYYRTFLSLVTEADFSSGGVDRVSEQIVTAFCLGHPTLVLGNPLNIRMMADWGFETFGDVLDQSYDRTLDPGLRFREVFAELSRQASAIKTQPARWLDSVREASVANLRHSHGGFLRAYRAQCDRKVIDNFKRMLA